jgi:two-component system alkaline phosphatase synthesis response regulator PhoP
MTTTEKTVLIVDDDADFVESLSSFLEMQHFNVLTARNGAEGLRIARSAHPDLILMDIMMGERTEGFFTIQEIRSIEELEHIPIFVLSSLYSLIPEFGISPDSSWLAHDHFLPKPVDMEELLDKIHARIGVPQ